MNAKEKSQTHQASPVKCWSFAGCELQVFAQLESDRYWAHRLDDGSLQDYRIFELRFDNGLSQQQYNELKALPVLDYKTAKLWVDAHKRR